MSTEGDTIVACASAQPAGQFPHLNRITFAQVRQQFGVMERCLIDATNADTAALNERNEAARSRYRIGVCLLPDGKPGERVIYREADFALEVGMGEDGFYTVNQIPFKP